MVIIKIMHEHELKSRIKRVMAGLEDFAGRGGVYYPMEVGHKPQIGGSACRFCAGCLADRRAGTFCRNTVCTSAVQGYSVGDAWYFRCWLGLDSFAIPIAPPSLGEIVGVIEVGGFIAPGHAHNAQEIALSRLSGIDALDLFQVLFGSLQALPETEFSEIKAVADFLLEATFSEGLNSASFFAMRRRVSEQQRRLAVKVQELQTSYPRLPSALRSLAEVFECFPDNDLHGARVKLDDFLGNMLLNSGASLERGKSYLLLLLGALNCERLLGDGRRSMYVPGLDERLIELSRKPDIESLCYWAEELLVGHFNRAQRAGTQESRRKWRVSDRVLDYVRRNYMRDLSLSEVARAAEASPSSVIHGLKRETGRTFVQHLTEIRIREAKRLLAYSTQSLGEISRLCGFKDQSYFTKVFRREINLAPREFRNMLSDRLTGGASEDGNSGLRV